MPFEECSKFHGWNGFPLWKTKILEKLFKEKEMISILAIVVMPHRKVVQNLKFDFLLIPGTL